MAAIHRLNFISSIPHSGAVGVSRDPIIQLVFSSDVTNDSVWNNNRTQIRLFRGPERVIISVTRSENLDLRRTIYARPINPLRPLTDYRVVILPGLTALNGTQLGEPVTIRFRTTGEIPEE